MRASSRRAGWEGHCQEAHGEDFGDLWTWMEKNVISLFTNLYLKTSTSPVERRQQTTVTLGCQGLVDDRRCSSIYNTAVADTWKYHFCSSQMQSYSSCEHSGRLLSSLNRDAHAVQYHKFEKYLRTESEENRFLL